MTAKSKQHEETRSALSQHETHTLGGITYSEAMTLFPSRHPGSFYKLVKAGQIRRFKQPGRSFWQYVKADVQTVAEQMTAFPADRYYTTDQVRQLLGGVVRSRVLQLAQEHQIPRWYSPRRSNLSGFLKTAVDELLAQRQAKASVEPSVFPNTERYSRLYARLFPEFVRWVAGQVRGDIATAEDVVQDAFLTLWQNDAKVFAARPDDADLVPYIALQVRGAFHHHLARRHAVKRDDRRVTSTVDADWTHPATPQESVEKLVIDRDLVQKALKRLEDYPPYVRLSIRMLSLGYTYQDMYDYIRQRCGVPSWQVESWIRKVRIELTPLWEEEYLCESPA